MPCGLPHCARLYKGPYMSNCNLYTQGTTLCCDPACACCVLAALVCMQTPNTQNVQSCMQAIQQSFWGMSSVVTRVGQAQFATHRAAVWKRDLVSMLPKCTPNSSKLDSSMLLNTVPLDTPVCFLFNACTQQIQLLCAT